MNTINRMVESLSKLNQDTVSEIVTGTVLSVNPLKIRISDRITLGENFLTVSPLCRSMKATVPKHKHSLPSSGSTEETGITFELWPGLAVRDKVKMFSFTSAGKGTEYYVAERIGQ